MQRCGFALVCLLFTAAISAQGPAPRPSQLVAKKTPSDGNLAQVMRGMLFGNANLVFDVQLYDPGAPPSKTAAPDASVTGAFANVYSGWEMVEAAAVTLEEAADVILKPGRLCSNGKPAPVTRPDYIKFAEALRVAGRKALIAARTRNQEQVSDVTSDIDDACSSCHEVYRDKGPFGSPARCTP